ncbi:MAG: helix-turn-helix domain-containing protein [bacterium]|nr:helix-turn-helix domain-containing protein [bacterium]
MNISEKIKMLRKEKRLTQAMLAESLNVARSTVIAWEGKRCLPEGENLKNIARTLGTTVAFLLGESDATGVPVAASDQTSPTRKEASSIILKLSEVRYALDALGDETDMSDLRIIDELLSSCQKISALLLAQKTAAGRGQ